MRTIILCLCIFLLQPVKGDLKRFPGAMFGKPTSCKELPGLLLHVGPMTSVYMAYLTTLRNGLGRNISGVELGALHSPASLPAFCNTTYVDYADKEHLQKVYPNMFVKAPDIVDDAVYLSKLSDNTYDYIISSHVMEHLPNFLLSLANQIRVLRIGGLMFIALPCMCGTFDQDRLVTTTDHFLEEYSNPTLVESNKVEHFNEWALSHVRASSRRLATDDEIARWGPHFLAANYPIHYHTFTPASLLEVLVLASQKVTPFRILHMTGSVSNIRVVLQRLPEVE